MSAPAAFDVPQVFARTLALHQAGQLAEAERLYAEIIAAAPGHAASLHLLGVLKFQRGDAAAAVRQFDTALALEPNNAFAHSNRSVALAALARFEEALASADKALALKPDHAEAWSSRAAALFELRRFDEALASAERAIALKPNHADAYASRGNVHKQRGALEEAIVDYGKAIELNPTFVRAIINRAVALGELRRFDEALADCDRAIALNAGIAEAFNNRGNVLYAWGRLDEALASLDQAIALKPDYADAFYNRGNVLAEQGRLADAEASHATALSLAPSHAGALGGFADCASRLCDWSQRDEIESEIRRRVADGSAVIPPLTLLRYCNDEAGQLACARRYAASRVPESPRSLPRGSCRDDGPIRLAYLSADFRQHPVAQLIVELIERHDRTRFEVAGVSLGLDDGSALRTRLIRAFDCFDDVRAMSDHAVATLLHERQTDIVIDLMGYTHGCRPRILAHRPAPIAVNYLGYPGTMGAGFIDYIIADAIALPLDRQPHFTERIVHLPDCFQANTMREEIPLAPTRREVGLPDAGFVFCCFNNHAKIAPRVFDVWMRLLDRIEGSVLWLSQASAATAANLRREATARGIDPARLVFAPRTQRFADHLARHRLAGLFLDTLPYNAHTTAADALRAGLPVLTRQGHAMAGRVAASLLHAVRLPDLVTASLDEYEALALRLARDPAQLASIVTRLEANLATAPLFDADRFRRNIEAAYRTMWEIAQRGEPAQSFAVTT
jgi:predicted O-linked N-acetylglucosamine transferase (SPINDLY family)